MSKLSESLVDTPSRREPPYRPLANLSEEERAELVEKIGDLKKYSGGALRTMIEAAPDNIELRKALVSATMSAEFAGVDSFGRKVCEWQEWDVPWSLIMAVARQTWDEARHAQLAIGALESYGGKVGEYPDTFAGLRRTLVEMKLGDQAKDIVANLSVTNVAFEGQGLISFINMTELGRKIGDSLLEHCFDYNWADEITHVAIGDYFVKLLCEGNPKKERDALIAHARWELSDQQLEELIEAFAEEEDRAQQVAGVTGSETDEQEAVDKSGLRY